MPTYKQLAKSNNTVDCTGQRAVVAGGTGGIGSGVALRYALSGANVWLIGRNEQRGKAILDQLRLASAEGHRRRNPNAESGVDKAAPHEFFSADLSSVEDVSRVAKEIASKAGEGGVDWLVQAQGGPPTGKFKPPSTPSSPEGGFAVQCASRFGLAYHLTTTKTIKRGICLIASPGNGGSKPIDVDDLDLTRAEKAGKYTQGLFGILPMGQRHASILDAITQELAERNPNLAVSHLFPGLVGTDAAATAGFPTPLVWGSKVATWLGLISSPTLGSYPEVPFYLHANSEGGGYLRLGEANLLGPYFGRKELSGNVREKSVRRAIWDRLEGMFQ